MIGYVAKNTRDGKAGLDGFILSLAFTLGFSGVFATIGGLVGFIGGLLSMGSRFWLLVVGAVLVLAGMHYLRLIRFKIPMPVSLDVTKVKFGGVFGALVIGVLMGLAMSPCATPVIAIILTYTASMASPVFGIAMLFAYSLGHGVLLMIAGTSAGFILETKLLKERRQIIEYASGVLFIILGIYFLWSA